MSLTRQTQKVFASNANANQLAVFGSMKTGTPVYSTSLSTLQSTAYTEGWSEAILNDKAPYMEEMNAVQYGLSYQIAYLLQEGVGAYDANTNYSDTSIVKTIESGKLYFYRSLSDNNIGHALSDTDYWEKINISDTRNIGEIVQSPIPLTDAGLHPLDGSKLYENGAYGSFYTYMNGLYIATPTASYFCTEAQWQTAVRAHGVCGKFVIGTDTTGNYVRLPKYGNQIFTKSPTGTIPVKGNGKALGLFNGTYNFGLTYNTGAVYNRNAFNQDIGSSVTAESYNSGSTTPIGVTASGSKSGLVADISSITNYPLDCYYYIVVATATKTQIEVDIDEIATDLNGKLDKDGSNAVTGLFESAVNVAQASGKVIVAGWGMPDYTAGVSKTNPFTASENGWVKFDFHAAPNNNAQVVIGDYTFYANPYDNNDTIFVPISNGETATKVGNANLTAITFFPLKGAN